MKIIEIKKLNKTYSLGKLDIPVLRDIDLEIMQGEFIAIMGHSGSGKSTLLNILGLLDKPSEGYYKLAGIEISKYSDNELAVLRNRCLGFIFQQFNLLPKLTILENVALPIIYSNTKDESEHENPEKLLGMVGLSDRTNHHPNEISGGQQQRVAIARSLINKPLIIFADEPTGNLDTKSAKEIMDVLKSLNDKGITIVMVTHEPELTAYATRTIKMKDGLAVFDENLDQKKSGSINQHPKIFNHKFFSFSRIKNYFLEGTRSILGNKMRSILSILGVMIGIASLIAMMAVGTGAKKSIEREFAILGRNRLTVHPNTSARGGISGEDNKDIQLRNDDIKDIERNVPGIQAVTGFLYGRGQIVANGENYNTELMGVSINYFELNNTYPHVGRAFTETENMEREKLAILGRTVVKKIYGNENFNPVGKYVKINRIDFHVIGVFPAKGMIWEQDIDDKIVIPLNTAMYRVFGNKNLNFISMQRKDNIDMQTVSDAVIKRLLFTHRMSAEKKEALSVYDWAEYQKAQISSTRTFSYLFGAIALISLLVGGVGIMNIMFTSVSERTKEIGLRKAIGANNMDILFQFIIESVFICCIGGIVGILLGSGVAIIIGRFASWKTYITPFSIEIAFCFSCFIGIIFSIWPARRAALLNPIDALRYD
jgi:macrolide transport system ATP-binding/permease protein